MNYGLLANQGQGEDNARWGGQVAHISALEADLLRRMGGAGTTNPMTGLPEYYTATSSYSGPSSSAAYGAYGQGGQAGGPGGAMGGPGPGGGHPMGFLVGEGGNVANAYGKGIAAFSGPTVTTNIASPKVVSRGELAYLGALANVNAGVPGWGLGKAAPGNVYGMTPGLTGVPGYLAGQSTSWGQFLGNVMKMGLASLSPLGIPTAILANMAEGGTFGADAAALAKSLSAGQLGPGLANAAGLPGGYVAPQAGVPGRGSAATASSTPSQQLASIGQMGLLPSQEDFALIS